MNGKTPASETHDVHETDWAPGDVIWMLFLALSVLALFGKVMLSGESLFGSDFILQFYPWKKFLYETVQADGTLPFWNPLLFSGTPFIANIQASMFYPFGFLYYLLPPVTAYLYSTLLHCVMGGVFMYALMRTLGCFRPGAFLSGFIFIFNGYFMAHLYGGHLSFVQNYIWIPLIFLFLLRFMQTRRMGYCIWGGLVLGVQILGGFPQIAFYTLGAIVLFSLYSAWLNRKRDGIKGAFRTWVGASFLISAGFAVAAVQLLPTYEFTQLSTRAGGVGYEFATMDSLPPGNLLTFLFPLLFGSPIDGSYWISDRTWEFWEYCGYGGVPVLVMIGLAMGKLRRDPVGLFFILLGLMALFLAFGSHNPLYPLIYRLPGFGSFRIPAQILFLYMFAVSVLCGKALEALFSVDGFTARSRNILFTLVLLSLPMVVWASLDPGGFCRFMVPGGVLSEMDLKRFHEMAFAVSHALLVGFCFFFGLCVIIYLRDGNRIGRRMFVYALIGLSMVDTGSFAFPLIRTFDMAALQEEGLGLSPITEQSGISRSLIDGKCFIENAGLWYGFQDIQGYDPLILRRYMAYVNRSQDLPPDNKVVNMHYIKNVHNSLIRMLNLKYVVGCRTRRIQTVSPFVPRCHVVHGVEIKDPREILDFMMQKTFDPLQTVVFETGQAPLNFIPRRPERGADESCRILWYENDEMDLVANLNTPGFLVLSEIQYPGWRASVNGRERKVFRGNYLFRVLPLKEGRHEIHLVFRPFSFTLGACVSLAALLVMGVLVLYFKKAKRFSGRGVNGPV